MPANVALSVGFYFAWGSILLGAYIHTRVQKIQEG